MNLYDLSSQLVSAFILILALSTAIYLLIKRNEFPYSNISPIWVIITLISKTNYLKNRHFPKSDMRTD